MSIRLARRLIPTRKLAFTRVVSTLLVLTAGVLIFVQLAHLYSDNTATLGNVTPVRIDEDTSHLDAEINEAIASEHNQRPPSSLSGAEGDSYKEEDFNFAEYEFDENTMTGFHEGNINELIQKDTQFKNFINNKILGHIIQSKPACAPVNNVAHYNAHNKYGTSVNKKLPVTNGKLRENNIVDPVRSKEYLSSFLKLSEKEKEDLKMSHENFLNGLPDSYPEGEVEFSGDGILYAGGGNYNWLVLVSLKMLRDTGCKLPVEVFIPTDAEYSVDLCDHVFPILGAKCIVMSSFLDKKLNFRLKGYQLKSMALLLSSFERVLLLDSDNIPVKNPEHLFVNEPFNSKGMVVWPDFWRRSTSPAYYDIVGIPVDETKQVRFSYGDERDYPDNFTGTLDDYQTKISYHDLDGTLPEASSESGQLLINRRTHARAIFLSLYYNYYGPQYYYGLMSQGQAGEGDKETYLAAAHRLNLPYYQVQEFIREYGFVRPEDGGINIAAMGQYDPVIDKIQTDQFEKYKSNFDYNSSRDNYHFHRFKKSETLFLHCNDPKLYPWKVRGSGLEDLLSIKEGRRRRLYSDLLVEELGFDFELKIMETLQWVLCEHGDLNIKGMRDPEVYCEKVKAQAYYLKTGIDETLEETQTHVDEKVELVTVDNV